MDLLSMTHLPQFRKIRINIFEPYEHNKQDINHYASISSGGGRHFTEENSKEYLVLVVNTKTIIVKWFANISRQLHMVL